MLRKYLLFVVFCVVVNAAKLPKFFKKCQKHDPNLELCVANAGNDVIKHLAHGVNQIKFPSLKPLKVPYMQVDVGNNLKLNLTNSEISGIDNLHIEKVSINLTSRKYVFDCFNPRFEHLGTYDVSGRILILPIEGHGPINTTFVNSTLKFSFDFDLIEKKNKTYMVPKNPNYVYMPERAYFKLNNLFNGNEVLGSEMNKFMDANWKEVNQEIGTGLGDVIGVLLVEILKGFMGVVPFDSMFANESLNSKISIKTPFGNADIISEVQKS